MIDRLPKAMQILKDHGVIGDDDGIIRYWRHDVAGAQTILFLSDSSLNLGKKIKAGYFGWETYVTGYFPTLPSGITTCSREPPS